MFVASALVLLFGMTAVAVDVGAGFNERRADQTASDTAVVGGLLWSLIGTTANTLQEGLDQAKAVASANSRNGITQADWNACTDPAGLARASNAVALGLTGGSDCISWNASFTKMRVRMPTQFVDTTFGRILGLSTLRTSAVAEAGIAGLGNGGSLPSGALGNAGGGTEICIKTGTGSSAIESCGAPSTGDFQNFRPYFYNEIDPATSPNSACTSGEQTDPISRAFADGIDHYFASAPGLDMGLRQNGAQCPSFPGPAFPDHVQTAAGYQNTDITQGLVTGGNWDGAFNGRLDRGPYQSNPAGTSPNGFSIFSFTIDNRPLWSYIDTSLTLHPDCVAVASLPDNPTFQTTPAYTVGTNTQFADDQVESWDETKQLMKACLANQTGALFDVDALAQSPRLASVPRFWETVPCSSNNCLYDIKDFVPVFIQDMWTTNTTSWVCTGEVIFVAGDHCRHQPGMTGEIAVSAPGQQRVSSASSYILRCEHFNEEVCKSVQTSTGTTTLIADIRLTK